MNWMRWRSFGLLGLVCCLAGCPDGYPTSSPDDADFPASSVDMTPTQRLQRLNEMGADASPHRRWTYTFAPGCRLEVEHQARRLLARTQVTSVPLLDTEIRIEALDTEPVLYRVIGSHDATGQAQSQAVSTLLHDQGSWPDAIQFRALLNQLQRDCRLAEDVFRP